MINEEIKLDENAVEMLKETVGGGGGTTAYYRHIVDCETNDSQLCFQGYIRLEIINTSDTEFDFTSLYNYLAPLSDKYDYPCLTSYNGDYINLDVCYASENQIKSNLHSDIVLTAEHNKVYDVVIPMQYD